jgi:predicted TIM-barrel fold metal-dependent hydrolase
MIVDVHAHMLPRRLGPILKRNNLNLMMIPAITPAGTPTDDSEAEVDARLKLMDKAGTDIQILSPPPIPALATKADTIEAAQIVNDSFAKLIRRHPDRFRAFAWLPLPYVDVALAEMRRAIDSLALAGVNLLCATARERSTADVEFDPLYDEMNKRGTIVFYHPYVNGICSPLVNNYQLTGMVGVGFEDTIIVLHLIGRQIPHRFPNIKMIVPHLGGMLPLCLSRIDNLMQLAHPNLPELPSNTIRRFWYDSVSHGSAVALRCACEAFGATQIIAGSDYPAFERFGGYGESFREISAAGLPAADVMKILRGNAANLFGLPPIAHGD